MPTKKVRATVDGRAICVVNTWFSGAWIEVDGEVVAKTNGLINTDTSMPLLDATIVGASGKALHVEAFIAAVVTVRMMLAVNGVRVAGDVMVDREAAAAAREAARLEAGRSSASGGSPVAVGVFDRRTR